MVEGHQRFRVALLAGLLLAVVVTYFNHFGNSFHFDDGHTIIDNPAIRSLANIPRFFTDATSFSHLPAGQTYRPLVSTSIALDYWLARGLNPVWFHVSTFLLYLVQLLLMYRLFLHVLQRCSPDLQNTWVAWFAVALYGLHPASAETINYIIQRADLYVALGMVGGIVLYAWKPAWRRFGFYLIPPLCGMLSKATGLIFAPILFAYIFLIDRQSSRGKKPTDPEVAESLASCALRAAPAFLLCLVFSFFERAMTPPTFYQANVDTFDYWITQPYVTLRYVRSFFIPLYLNVDSDLQAFHSLASLPVLIGFLFLALLVYAAVITARTSQWRPVSFGLWWFLISLIPTAIFPLTDVENDHRMFLPFIGLSLAVVSSVALLLRRVGTQLQHAAVAAGFVVLVGFAYGAHVRNDVWHNDESLWRDDLAKSPNNPRGHDWLGAAYTKIPGRQADAIQEFQTALRLKPDDATAHLNLGKMLADTPGRSAEAIAELEKSVQLEPNADAHWQLGEVLSKFPSRLPETVREFEAAVQLDPDFFEARLGLGLALSQIPDRLPDAISQFQAALRLRPDDRVARQNLAFALARVPGRLPEAIQELNSVLQASPDSADAHVSLGTALALVPNRLPDAIREYETALKINPNSANAHFSLGLCLSKLPGRISDAITQYEAAIRIKPDLYAAHMNLGAAYMAVPGKVQAAISEFQSAQRLRPEAAEPHSNLGVAYSRVPGRLPDALTELEASYRIKADPTMGRAIESLRAQLPTRR